MDLVSAGAWDPSRRSARAGGERMLVLHTEEANDGLHGVDSP